MGRSRSGLHGTDLVAMAGLSPANPKSSPGTKLVEGRSKRGMTVET